MRRGVSLIVLIISIIVMIIIAGAIIISLMDGGIIAKAMGAVKAQEAATMKEELTLSLANLKIHILQGPGEKTSYYEDKDKFAVNGQFNVINKEISSYIVNPENDDEIMIEIKYKGKESTYAYKLNVDSCKVEVLDGIDTTEKIIAYVLNGGTNEEGAATEYAEGEVVNLPNPTKEGVIFAGWYTKSDFSGNRLTRTTLDTRGNLTLYARWALPADTSYFTFTTSGANATITGLSTAGISAYDSGNLAELVIPRTYTKDATTYTITTINTNTFSSRINITSLVIPKEITLIVANAFGNCGQVAGELKVTIEAGRTTLSTEFLQGANYLKEITVPEGVTSIQGYNYYSDDGSSLGAFKSCIRLTSVTLPSTLTSIGPFVFFGCTSLTEMPITSNVTIIGFRSYKNCKFATANIPSSVKTIDSGAFGNCTNLTSVTLPETSIIIRSNTFSGCTKLSSITIPKNVTSIGANSFYNCGQVAGEFEVTIETGRTTLSNEFLLGANYLKEITVPEGVTSIQGYSNAGDDGYSSGAFKECTSLTSVTLPSTLTSIGPFVFFGCTSLTEMPITSNVTSIGVKAYRNCKFTTVNIPSSVKTIETGAFSNCTNLTNVVIPDTITAIGAGVFSGCTGITSATLPAASIALGSNTFYGCTKLSSITIPKNIIAIGANSFYNCGQVAGEFEVTIEAGRTTLSNELLLGANYLKEITVPEGVTSIQGYNYYNDDGSSSGAFKSCTSLTSVTLPSTLTSIGPYVFFGCTKLAAISLPANIGTIAYKSFKNCTTLATINYNNTVESWSAVTKVAGWNTGVIATGVTCTNGTASF